MPACKNCGKEFTPKDMRKNREYVYCSQKCMGEFSRKKETRTCLHCGKEFIQIGKSRPRKFCSFKCSTEYRVGEHAHNWNGGDIKLICVVCGSEYHVRKSQAIIYHSKYCSRKCMGINQSTQILGESRRWKGGKVKRICKICGKEFLRAPSQSVGVRGNLCSATCRSAHCMLMLNSYSQGKETSIERILADVLDKLGISYEKQKPIGMFFADIYIKKDNLIIEADGDYWHNRPGAKTKDDRKNDYIISNGYNLLRIWEHDIHRDAAEIIVQHLASLRANQQQQNMGGFGQ